MARMLKPVARSVLIVILAVLAGWAGVRSAHPVKAEQTIASGESAYDRIMRTRTIRCMYILKPPFMVKDPNTGKLSGLFVDYMNALGALTDLKIEWTQELVLGTYLQDLAEGRADMECASGWPSAKRGQYAFYPKPYAYIPMIAVVREDDHRFDDNPESLNDPAVRISTLDGDMASAVRSLRFPKSQDISLPQTAALTDEMMNVVTEKADVALMDVLVASKFAASNPGKVRLVRHKAPLFMIALSPTLPQDIRLKQMVDVANDQLLNTGKVEEILRAYETEPGQFLRVALPFRN